MGMFQYVTNLTASTKSKAIKENLELANERISNNLIPGADMLLQTLKPKYEWKNKDIKATLAEIAQAVRGHDSLKLPRDAVGMEAIRAVMSNLQSTIPYVIAEANKTFDDSIFKAGLTFTKATLLQYAESVDFFVSYTAALLNWVTALEYNTLDGRDKNRGIPPSDLEFLLANINNYTEVLKILAFNRDELKRGLKSLPQMRIADTAEAEAEQLLLVGNNANPFGFATLPWPLSMWYHYRLRRVEAQAQEYEKAIATEKAVNYRILLIKQRIDSGRGDAALEKELELQDARVKEISFEIKQMEKKWDLNLEG